MGNLPPGKLAGTLGALERFLARVAALMPREMLQAIEGSVARWTDVFALVLVVLGGFGSCGHDGGGDGRIRITCDFDHRFVTSRTFGTRNRNRHHVECRQRRRNGRDRFEFEERGWRGRKSLRKFSSKLGYS